VFLEGTPPIDAEAVLLATAYGLPAQGEGALSAVVEAKGRIDGALSFLGRSI
jgi:hypothetical protein